MKGTADETMEDLTRRLRRVRLKLGPAARRVLDILADDPGSIACKSSLDIAERAQTSDATVIRTIQTLGFSGLKELRELVEAADRNSSSTATLLARTLSELAPGIDGALAEVVSVHRRGLAALRKEAQAGVLEIAISTLCAGRRIVVCAPPRWTGLRSHFRAGLSDLGVDAVEEEISLVPEVTIPPARKDDVVVVFALPNDAVSRRSLFDAARTSRVRVIVVTNVQVPAATAPDVIALCAPCGKPGHITLGGPVAALIDMLILGLAAYRSTLASQTSAAGGH